MPELVPRVEEVTRVSLLLHLQPQPQVPPDRVVVLPHEAVPVARPLSRYQHRVVKPNGHLAKQIASANAVVVVDLEQQEPVQRPLVEIRRRLVPPRVERPFHDLGSEDLLVVHLHNAEWVRPPVHVGRVQRSGLHHVDPDVAPHWKIWV